jgi:inorganic pyrophosphatase
MGRSLPEMAGIVFAEIPAGSRNKYEWDEDAGGIGNRAEAQEIISACRRRVR